MPSYYDDEDDRGDDRHRDRGGRGDRDRDRDRDRGGRSRRDGPVYEEEEIIEARRGPARDRDPRDPRAGALVPRRRDDSESSIEEIDRKYPPKGYGGGRDKGYPPRRAKSHGGGRYDDDYDDRPRKKDRRRRRDYSSSSLSSSPEPRRKPERRKSLVETALAAAGIGAGAGAVASKHDRGKSRDRERDRRGGGRSRRDSYSSDSRSRSRTRGGGRGGDQKEQLIQAAKAALTAGAVEAFRSRKEPGGWAGPKGKRVLTAAIGAGGIDGLLQNKDGGGGGTMQSIQSVIGGLAGNRLINGARDKDGSRSRSRSRSRGGRDGGGGGAGGGLAGLAAGGLAAAAGKAFMDRNKSSDRGDRGRRYSDDDNYGRSSGKRSKSVTDYARDAMNKISGGGKVKDRGSRRDYSDDDDYAPRPRGGGGEGGDGIKSELSSQSSSDDDVSSSEEDQERKQMGKRQLITAGLASVATIHAAQSVYKSIEGRKERKKEVAKGEMSPAEAKKKKNKARLQDASAVGIAALGIKSAYGEWKEMKEQRDEAHEFDIKRAERHARREQRAVDAKKYGITHGYGDGQGAYRASAPDLSPPPTTVYPNGGGYQGQGAYMSGGAGSGVGGGYYGEPSGPHYSDGNPFHTGGVPPPPMGPEPPQY
ncbi:hypothetical protein P7C71_g5166, partial [Lecanoromycetidae sp. Uapishka_2]